MTIRNLDGFFAPRSIALIGPSRHGQALTDKLLENLKNYADHHTATLIGIEASLVEPFSRQNRLSDLAQGPDLAICLGAKDTLPQMISDLGRRGTRTVLLPSPGYESWPSELLQTCREAARETQMRLIGPGSLGLAVPAGGLNALLSSEQPIKGEVAFIARSGAVLNATLSWAKSHSFGFSAVVSLGDRMDVDLGDLIDYFAQDYRTRAILLHLEGISSPRKFLSAARAAARSKPVIVIRSGRSQDVTGTGRTHAGRLADPDLVYEAAFRRAGLLRVLDLDEMFEAVETLSRIRIPKCERLAVLANGHSLACLATDRIVDKGGQLADLSDDTLTALAPFCRPQDSTDAQTLRQAQVTLRDDLPPEQITDAVTTLLKDTQVDGAVVLQAGSAFVPLNAIGNALAQAAEQDRRRTGRKKALVAALVGGDGTTRVALDSARVPCYASPAEATRALMHLAHDAQARDFLMSAPPSLPSTFKPDTATARAIVEKALEDGRVWMTPEEVCSVLSAYDIPIIETALARDAAEAGTLSQRYFETSRHCVAKLVSPNLPFKSRIDGIRLGLENPEAVRTAAAELLEQTRANYPHAKISGISIHPMLEDRHGLELYLGLADTPVFGPVIVFGHGGTAVEDSADISLELPPLDLNLAHGLIRRTRIAKLLDGGESRPGLDRDAVAEALVKLSQITIDLPEILELDINPIVARQDGILALDARVTLGRPEQRPGRSGRSRLAIAPYPREWEQEFEDKTGRHILVRPVRPDDEDLFRAFFEAVTPEDLRLRFFAPVRDFSHRFLARLTQLDYARAMAFGALDKETGDLLGVVRLHADPDHQTGEYAVMVRSDLKGTGLGWALMKLIIRYARADGIKTVKGEVLKENSSMLSMCDALGFTISTSPDDPGIAMVTLPVADIELDSIP